jgi:hypothetical protein
VRAKNDTEAELLPSDVKGRIACVLIGLFFSISGGPVCMWLLTRPFRLHSLVIYELAFTWCLFGVGTLLWRLFMPNWIRTFTQHVVVHLVLVIALLFVPFALQAVLLF